MKEFNLSNCRINFLSVSILCAGFLFIIVGQMFLKTEVIGVNVGSVLNSIGTFVTVVVLLQFIFDHFVRTQYFAEISATIIKSTSVRDSGISEYFLDSKEIKYHDLIKHSEVVEIFLHSSSRIIKDYKEEWEYRYSNGKTARFYYLKKDGDAYNYLLKAGVDKALVDASLNEVQSILSSIDSSKTKLEFFEHNCVLSYSCFCFDKEKFFVMSTNSKEKCRVPALQIKHDSPLCAFMDRDLERLKKDAKKP